MVGPEAFAEVRYLAHAKQLIALERIPGVAREFADELGRAPGALVAPYLLDGAETVVVAMGSVLGTLKDTVDGLRESGMPVGVLGITTFRPFPLRAVRDALASTRRVVVLEKAFAIGMGGILAAEVATALESHPCRRYAVVAGLGGRPITKASISGMLQAAARDELEPLSFLDLNRELAERELERMRLSSRSGPGAENMLRDVGIVGSDAV